MSGASLPAAYFDGIFEADDDPWDLATSDYEAAKFRHTIDALTSRRYGRAFEIGCAHGVLTGQLAGLCDTLLAVDISGNALAKARERVGDKPRVILRRMAFPRDVPEGPSFDLVILSEVAYYWDVGDLGRAGEWLHDHVTAGGQIILVHYTGETDYPQSGDEAVTALWGYLEEDFVVVTADRRDRYRLDLWERG